MAYTNYAYYTGTFLGIAIASTDFPRLELRARSIIDLITNQQAAAIITAGTDTAKVDAIKMAICAAAEELSTQESNQGRGTVASESTGRHSISYANPESAHSNRQRVINAASLYLESTDLLYRGIYPVTEENDDAM